MRSSRFAVLAGILGAVVVGLVFRVHTADAQRRGRGRNRPLEPSTVLASATRLNCSFPVSAAVAWADGDPQIAVKQKGEVFTMTMLEIDAQEGTAQVIGLGPPTHVIVKLVGANLHFLDIRPTGALAITTVFAEESHDGRLKAAHSRSDYVGGAVRGGFGPPAVSQYYGDCDVESR